MHVVPPMRRFPTNPTGPTRHETDRDGWRRTSYGFWVPSYVDPEPVEQRIVEAAANLGEFGGVTGWAGLAWIGARWFNGLERDGITKRPVVLAADCKRKPVNAVLSEERLLPGELIQVDGVVLTLPIRSVTFEMRYASSVRQAVVVFEMAAYDDLISIAELEAYLPSLSGWTGVPQLRAAFALVVENSWSPQETRLRLVWLIDAELPAPLCNQPVFDLDGNLLGTPDLLDVEAGLIVQYDGPDHLDPEQAAFDRAQDLRYLEHGLVVLRVDRHDLEDRHRLAVRLDEARDEALAHPAPRGWTVVQPDWWVSTTTVAERRALDTDDRARWLRYRSVA